MRYIIKRKIDLFGEKNTIKFEYFLKINSSKNGLENFDIGNEEILIDSLLTRLNEEVLINLNKEDPIYLSLSSYFFDNIEKLCAIEYETFSFSSRIERQDLF